MARKKLSLNTLLLIGMALGFVTGFTLNLAHVGETEVRISEVFLGEVPYVEIANTRPEAVDLSGWRLRLQLADKTHTYTFPSGSRIEPRSFVIVAGGTTFPLPVIGESLPPFLATVSLDRVELTEDENQEQTEEVRRLDFVAVQWGSDPAGAPPPRDWGAPVGLGEGEVSVYRESLIDSGTWGDWMSSGQPTRAALHDDQPWPRAFISNGVTRLLREVLNLLGETIFIGLLKMVIIPLILVSVVTGISGIGETSRVGSLGLKTVIYYLSTTFIAVGIGIGLVNLIQPGVGFEIRGQVLPESIVSQEGGFMEAILQILRNIVPTNIFKAMANMDILPIIVFAILFGVVLLQMGPKGKAISDLFQSLNELMMRLTKLVMKLGPIGVAALVAELVWLKIDIGELIYLVKYMVTVLSGLFIHGVIVLPIILALLGRTSPLRYAKAVSPALLTAFSTDSSSATLPVTIEATRRAGVPSNVGSFVLPLGATVNMDGTALYESVAAIFIAQAYLGHNLEIGQQVIVFMTATLAAIGAAGIPSAGIVMMLIVLKALNLPAEGVALVLAVDRIVDQCRTTVNVWGDTVGAAVITRLEGQRLQKPPDSAEP